MINAAKSQSYEIRFFLKSLAKFEYKNIKF